MTVQPKGKPTKKECLNCGQIFQEEWGSKVLLDHDDFHRKQIGWIERID